MQAISKLIPLLILLIIFLTLAGTPISSAATFQAAIGEAGKLIKNKWQRGAMLMAKVEWDRRLNRVYPLTPPPPKANTPRDPPLMDKVEWDRKLNRVNPWTPPPPMARTPHDPPLMDTVEWDRKLNRVNPLTPPPPKVNTPRDPPESF